MLAVSMSTESWITVVGFVVSVVLGVLGFAIHTTWQLGQIKGSLDRDLVELREKQGDHEERLRTLEHRKA